MISEKERQREYGKGIFEKNGLTLTKYQCGKTNKKQTQEFLENLTLATLKSTTNSFQ